MAESKYTLHAVKVNSTYIPIVDGSCDPSMTPFIEKAGSSGSPTFVGADSIKPVITASTPDLSTLLTAIAFTGTAITTAEVWFAERGALTTGTDGIKASGTAGIAIVESLTASTSGPASGSFRLVLQGTESVAPLTFTSTTLPTVSALSSVYLLGPLTIGTTTFETTNVTVNVGASVKNDVVGGIPWPTFVHIDNIEPTAQITITDNSPMTDLTAVGDIFENTKVYFREAKEGDVARETNGLSILFPKAHGYISGTGGGTGEDANLQVTFQVVKDGSENIATVTTSEAVPAFGDAA